MNASQSKNYRWAVVEDLQLPPAFALPQDEDISRAIALAYERDFSHIPVLDKRRRPVGYVDVSKLKQSWENGVTNPTDKVGSHMTKFNRRPSHPYTVITPETPLEDLDKFLRTGAEISGSAESESSPAFALVTDPSRKFVLAVATSQDLENFITRRGSGY